MSDASTSERPAAQTRLARPRARLGLIIPSVNTLSEPQFAHYCPAELGIHAARLRMSGKWKRPFAQIKPEIEAAAGLLGDIKPNLIVFHCTGASMREGPAGDAQVREIVRAATGIETIATGGAVVEALLALGMKKLVLVSPYVQSNNDQEVAYLAKAGFTVLRDVALGLKGGADYVAVTPERWVEIAVENDHAEADGFFLACTNTRQIEAIAEIERRCGKPVVNSNQAVMWAALDRLRGALGLSGALPGVGALMRVPARAT
jgi:maleate isomerase